MLQMPGRGVAEEMGIEKVGEVSYIEEGFYQQTAMLMRSNG